MSESKLPLTDTEVLEDMICRTYSHPCDGTEKHRDFIHEIAEGLYSQGIRPPRSVQSEDAPQCCRKQCGEKPVMCATHFEEAMRPSDDAPLADLIDSMEQAIAMRCDGEKHPDKRECDILHEAWEPLRDHLRRSTIQALRAPQNDDERFKLWGRIRAAIMHGFSNAPIGYAAASANAEWATNKIMEELGFAEHDRKLGRRTGCDPHPSDDK